MKRCNDRQPLWTELLVVVGEMAEQDTNSRKSIRRLIPYSLGRKDGESKRQCKLEGRRSQ